MKRPRGAAFQRPQQKMPRPRIKTRRARFSGNCLGKQAIVADQ
jgi:hypothetical protein